MVGTSIIMYQFSPKQFKWILNFYPPYLGAGVKVNYIKPDWSELKVSMKLRWYNRNAVGTHFGGSLYSMIDPHLMLLIMQRLGKNYIVWDKDASIDFLKPGKGKVSCVILVTQKDIDQIKQNTNSDKSFLPEFNLEIFDSENELVATVKKKLYVKRKIKEVPK